MGSTPSEPQQLLSRYSLTVPLVVNNVRHSESNFKYFTDKAVPPRACYGRYLLREARTQAFCCLVNAFEAVSCRSALESSHTP